ncbi:MAG: LytTR family DNA-binding domain-containing protein [Candidatus Marinimicrobia bacterium]|nr:LytTR family DNA-binding domain-containing protein [Candidatus Neomarinimicrobiota bacterium]MCF7827886.1 LytTR family DNA-binding domain-containing protein [Candidatus Neomarinimicrobiota bacterium]MCF7879359.1 LytTR family DNA-binding domain-containing protein [Candidatus Neomarinimicrobiota bacterium]
MKVVIIEDEALAAQKFRRQLREIDDSIEVVTVLESVENATNWLATNPAPDLIFMDIQLEDGLCFEIFDHQRIGTPVIFTTAYDAYTLKAFKVNSVDYLLKPIDAGELEKAIKKFRRVHEQNGAQKLDVMLNLLRPGTKKRFLIKIGEHYKSVPVSEIQYFFVRDRSVYICVDGGKQYVIDYSLDAIEEMIDPETFFRINRSIIVRAGAIRDMIAHSSSRLKLALNNWSGSENVIVSRERVADFKRWMDR